MADTPVTPEDLPRLVRMVKIALGVNLGLTVLNAGVLYALLVFVVAEPAEVDGVDPFEEADLAAMERASIASSSQQPSTASELPPECAQNATQSEILMEICQLLRYIARRQ